MLSIIHVTAEAHAMRIDKSRATLLTGSLPGKASFIMGVFRVSWKRSKKTILALVYVGIAIVLVVQGSAMTWAHVQFFDTMGALEVRVDALDLRLGDEASAIIYATLRNPTNFEGIRLWSVRYVVFVNSSSENFSPQGGMDASEFGVREVSFEQGERTIPRNGVLNITYVLSPHPDVVEPLKAFYSEHSAEMREFVGITLVLTSSFGFIEVPHCYDLPSNVFTLCPGLEVPPRTRFG